MTEEHTFNHAVATLRNYQKPEHVNQELDRLMVRKNDVEQRLANLERQIYALEGTYVQFIFQPLGQDTKLVGNVLIGWSNAIAARNALATANAGAKRLATVEPSDRLFSLSSITSVKVIDEPPKNEPSEGSVPSSIEEPPPSEEPPAENPPETVVEDTALPQPAKKRGRKRKTEELS